VRQQRSETAATRTVRPLGFLVEMKGFVSRKSVEMEVTPPARLRGSTEIT